MSVNPQTFYLAIQRGGKWEESIQSEDEKYLEDTAQNWMRQELIQAYRISNVNMVQFRPKETRKGAFGIRIDVV